MEFNPSGFCEFAEDKFTDALCLRGYLLEAIYFHLDVIYLQLTPLRNIMFHYARPASPF